MLHFICEDNSKAQWIIVQLHHLVGIFNTSRFEIFLLLLQDAAIMWEDKDVQQTC